MLRRWVPLAITLASVSCTTSKHFAAEYRDARTGIDRAEDAGAKQSSKNLLELARQTLDDARDVERRAIRDREEGKRELRDAQRRRDESMRLISERRGQLDGAKAELESVRADVASIEGRGAELRRSGASEDEVRAMTDVPLALARVRIRELEAAIAAREDQVRARELELEDSQRLMDAAVARISTADKSLAVARSLFVHSQEQARVAEARAYDSQRASSRAHLTGM